MSGVSKSILIFILDAHIPKFTFVKFEKTEFYLGNE